MANSNTVAAPQVNINKKLFALALPMAGIQFITVCSGFLCMVMLAHLGKQVLAASSLIFATQMSITVIGMSILFSLSVLVGRAFGAKDYALASNYLRQSWALALLISVPIMLFFANIGSLLDAIGQPQSIIAIVQQFFHAYIWAVPPLFVLVCNQQFCYGTHKQKLVVSTSIVGVIVLLLTAYILIFGKFGLPALGVKGLGYAMAVQIWFAWLFLTANIYFDKFYKQFKLFSYPLNHGWAHLRQIVKVGWPISLQVSSELLAFYICALMAGWLGTDALAANQIVSQCVIVVVIPVFVFSQASGILVGQAYGGKQFYQIPSLGRASVRLIIMIALCASVLFLLAPKQLASIYIDIHDPANAEILHFVVLLFAIIAFSQIADAVRNVLTGALRGLLDTKFPMYAGIFSLWVLGIPLSYLLAFKFSLGLVGIALGSAISVLIGTFILLLRWQKQTRPFTVLSECEKNEQ